MPIIHCKCKHGYYMHNGCSSIRADGKLVAGKCFAENCECSKYRPDPSSARNFDSKAS